MQNRNALRRQLRTARRALSPTQQAYASHKVFVRLMRHPWLRSADNIAVYLANDGELDPIPIVKWARRHNKRLYLPCLESNQAPLVFKPWRRGAKFRDNRFGIAEPVALSTANPNTLDAILVPLVGFDEFGNRLGMGGGFYDRTFAKLQPRTNLRPRLIGLAHSTQRVAYLNPNRWDEKLDAIVTEKQIFTRAFRKNRKPIPQVTGDESV